MTKTEILQMVESLKESQIVDSLLVDLHIKCLIKELVKQCACQVQESLIGETEISYLDKKKRIAAVLTIKKEKLEDGWRVIVE